MAQAFAISKIKIVEVEKASEISDFDKFEKAMALYQKLQQSNAKTVYASVESYEEFFNDTKINKEDVSFAKIGPEWPRGLKIGYVSFSVIGLMCLHLILPRPMPITGLNFLFLLATQFQQRMYLNGCHQEKKLKCGSRRPHVAKRNYQRV